MQTMSTKPVYLLNVQVCDVPQKLASSNDNGCKLQGSDAMFGDVDLVTTS